MSRRLCVAALDAFLHTRAAPPLERHEEAMVKTALIHGLNNREAAADPSFEQFRLLSRQGRAQETRLGKRTRDRYF